MIVYQGYVYRKAFLREDASWEKIVGITRDLTKIALASGPDWPHDKKRRSFAERYKSLREQLEFVGLTKPLI